MMCRSGHVRYAAVTRYFISVGLSSDLTTSRHFCGTSHAFDSVENQETNLYSPPRAELFSCVSTHRIRHYETRNEIRNRTWLKMTALYVN